MSRTVMGSIEEFEYETDNSIRAFNKIFRGSPIVSKKPEIKLTVGELTFNECRNLYLETGEIIENAMNFNYSAISPDCLTFAKYIYVIDDEIFSTLKGITDRFKGVTVHDITQSIEFNRPIKKYGGLLVEREIRY